MKICNLRDLCSFGDGGNDGNSGDAVSENGGDMTCATQGAAETVSEKVSGGEADTGREQTAKPGSVQKLLRLLASEYGTPEDDADAIMAACVMNRLRREAEDRLRRKNAQSMYKTLLSEAERYREINGEFVLEQELENESFVKLLQCGFGIEAAWKAVHADALIEKAAAEAESRGRAGAISLLRAGSLRPDENGLREQGGISRGDRVENLTGGGIRDILRRVEKGVKVKF